MPGSSNKMVQKKENAAASIGKRSEKDIKKCQSVSTDQQPLPTVDVSKSKLNPEAPEFVPRSMRQAFSTQQAVEVQQVDQVTSGQADNMVVVHDPCVAAVGTWALEDEPPVNWVDTAQAWGHPPPSVPVTMPDFWHHPSMKYGESSMPHHMGSMAGNPSLMSTVICTDHNGTPYYMTSPYCWPTYGIPGSEHSFAPVPGPNASTMSFPPPHYGHQMHQYHEYNEAQTQNPPPAKPHAPKNRRRGHNSQHTSMVSAPPTVNGELHDTAGHPTGTSRQHHSRRGDRRMGNVANAAQ